MVANHMVFLADGPHILIVLLVIGFLGFGALQIIHIFVETLQKKEGQLANVSLLTFTFNTNFWHVESLV